jgi:hypothetical protein
MINLVLPDYFGIRHPGSIMGAAHTSSVMGSAFGPLPSGFAFDYFDAYKEILPAMMLISTLAAAAAFKIVSDRVIKGFSEIDKKEPLSA